MLIVTYLKFNVSAFSVLTPFPSHFKTAACWDASVTFLTWLTGNATCLKAKNCCNSCGQSWMTCACGVDGSAVCLLCYEPKVSTKKGGHKWLSKCKIWGGYIYLFYSQEALEMCKALLNHPVEEHEMLRRCHHTSYSHWNYTVTIKTSLSALSIC